MHRIAINVRVAGRSIRCGIGRSTVCTLPSVTLVTSTVLITVAVSDFQR
jgi:hypothetical protein